jgi:glucose-6-phosphate isomerase
MAAATQSGTEAWATLTDLASRPGAAAVRPLLQADPGRFRAMARRGGDLLLDLSRTSITADVMAALLGLPARGTWRLPRPHGARGRR